MADAEYDDDWDENDPTWDAYMERVRRFRGLVRDADPEHRDGAPFMRYPGAGNRAQRRALRAKARGNR